MFKLRKKIDKAKAPRRKGSETQQQTLHDKT
jgi:hypothetical protein